MSAHEREAILAFVVWGPSPGRDPHVEALLAAGLARCGRADHVEPTRAGHELARRPLECDERAALARVLGEGPLEIAPCTRHAAGWKAWRLAWEVGAADQRAAQEAGQRVEVWPDACGLCSADVDFYD